MAGGLQVAACFWEWVQREKFTASADSLSLTHSSHLRLIGRGVPGLSFNSAIVQFLCDFPQEVNTQVLKLNPRPTISAFGTLAEQRQGRPTNHLLRSD